MTIDEKIFFEYEGRTWEAHLLGDPVLPEMVEVRNCRKVNHEWVPSDDLADLIRLPDLYEMQAQATTVYKAARAELLNRDIEERR
jgi:hypothetical protein